jgi:hypothetical protein
MRTPRPPAEQERYDRTLDAAGQTLEHDAYEQAWATGTTLPLQDAIALALSDVST